MVRFKFSSVALSAQRYGRYTSTDQVGIEDDLDSCGGHSDDVRNYHYHAETIIGTETDSLDGVSGSGPFTFNEYNLAPTNCWKGDVSQIANVSPPAAGGDRPEILPASDAEEHFFRTRFARATFASLV
jgi:hypothetical protein